MVVAMENDVAARCAIVHAVDNSKKVVVGEGVAIEAGSAGIAAVDFEGCCGFRDCCWFDKCTNSFRRT